MIRLRMTAMSMCGGPHRLSPISPSRNSSGRKVFCVKFQKELPGLDAPPWPGEIGQRLYEQRLGARRGSSGRSGRR